MKNDRKNLKTYFKKLILKKSIKINNCNLKIKHYIFISLIIVLNCLIFSFTIIRKNFYNNKKITKYIKNEDNSNYIDCLLIKQKLKNRKHPFDFKNELYFFIDLISCKIPFSFIRFGDGENLIMKGEKISTTQDNWYWNATNSKFQYNLIESSSICTNDYGFIGIPCKNWIDISKSILSFSKCSSAKYMSYATLFINKNYDFFKDWIVHFVNSSNRWKIILVANSIINKNISWAYKFFPIPDHLIENFDYYSISLISQLSNLAKQKNLIFFISAGPAANIIISILVKINNSNIYIDLGSSIEFLTKGYTTRSYAKNGEESNHSCEPFIIENGTVIYIK